MTATIDAGTRRVTTAKAISEAIAQEMRSDPNVFVMGEDVGPYGGIFGSTGGLFEEFGTTRIIDTPISEPGFTGMAVGAAMTGIRPVVGLMFGDFLFLVMDQLCNQAAKK
ncbi:MAG: alpha-ketoacid dehydrogenase subunit beta, partial [Candidatus Nanopelagicales bacterium]